MALLRRKHDKPEGAKKGQIVERAKGGTPLTRMREEMDRLFDRAWKDFGDPWSAMSRLPGMFGGMANWPAMDVAEDEKSYTIRLDVPGLEAKDLDVEVSGNQLTVRGQRTDEFKEDKKGVHRHERYSGSFARSVTLPSYVDASRIDAKYEKGMLTLTIPRMPGEGPKRVQVKGEA